MIALHRFLVRKPIEVASEVLEFGIVWIAAPCTDENAVERAFIEQRRGIVDDGDLGEVFGDLSQGLFVGFALGAVFYLLAKCASPKRESFDADEVEDALDVCLHARRPNGDVEFIAHKF